MSAPAATPPAAAAHPLGTALRVLALCSAVNMLDGFDLQAIAYVAPVLREAWSLDARALGLAFSSGLAGMAAGSVLLGPASDRFGRRRMILACVLLIGAATALTALARNLPELLALRTLTGFGIGGVLPSLNTLVAEYAPARHRNLMVAGMHLGYPLGATAGGFLAATMLPNGSWGGVFLAGGLATLALLPLLYFALPESPAFRTAAAAARQPPLDALRRAVPVRHTAALWAAFGTGYLALYFLMSWTPTLLVDAGLALRSSIYAGVGLNVGGGAGMLVLGAWSARRSLRGLIVVFFLLAGAGAVLMGQLVGVLPALIAVVVAVGFFGIGALIGLYSAAARLYPAEARASGVGLAIGVGRLGAIVGPGAGGLLLGLGWPMGLYFALLLVPLSAAALAMASIRSKALERPGREVV